MSGSSDATVIATVFLFGLGACLVGTAVEAPAATAVFQATALAAFIAGGAGVLERLLLRLPGAGLRLGAALFCLLLRLGLALVAVLLLQLLFGAHAGLATAALGLVLGVLVILDGAAICWSCHARERVRV